MPSMRSRRWSQVPRLHGKAFGHQRGECREGGRDGKRTNKKLVIGYILRVHPSWIKFIEIARTLGKPLVMRMNLNQQSNGRPGTGTRA